MRRTVLLGASMAFVVSAMACQEQITEPATDTNVSVTQTQLQSTVSSRLAGLPDGRLPDLARYDFESVINGGDYVCSATPLSDIVNGAITEIIADPLELLIAQTLLAPPYFAGDIPQLEAIVIAEENRKADYGYDGEYTNQMNRAINSLRRFWDIDSDAIHVVPMEGSMLLDTDRLVAAYTNPVIFLPPYTEAEALALAADVETLLGFSNLLNGGSHPLFDFNAFAFNGIAGLGIPPKIVMGDATLNIYDNLGFADVAPQAVLAHEWAHHIQFQNGYFDEPVPGATPPVTSAERTRYTELMADAMAAYYLTHATGGTLRQNRVEQFFRVFFEIGDCGFTDPNHHGTPNQRMAAARFGFDIADQAQKQGHVLGAGQFHDLFVAEYATLVAPDAP